MARADEHDMDFLPSGHHSGPFGHHDHPSMNGGWDFGGLRDHHSRIGSIGGHTGGFGSPPLFPPPPSHHHHLHGPLTHHIPPHLSVHPLSPPPPSVPNNNSGNQQPSPINANTIRSTLWWGELEAWMDEEYAKQVCKLMSWEPTAIRVPKPPMDPSGAQANNAGYCYLSFPSPAHAAQVLSQINSSSSNMPNSQKPFVVNWASNVPVPPAPPPQPPQPSSTVNPANPGFPIGPQQKEYSIFVGDLAPETSNSDLVAVFRNPVLGLRNDREPKFIRPFLSCKSAKIMLDPVTGVSRGYGFVRFTDESDQQRALIEMHGLYCLSRPMRISPATAKFKPPPGFDAGGGFQFPVLPDAGSSQPETPPKSSVSSTIAATKTNPPGPSLSITQSTSGSTISSGSSSSASSFPSTGSSAEDLPSLANNLLAQLARQYAANGDPSKIPGVVNPPNVPIASSPSPQPPRPTNAANVMEESWKHHAQARAILGNLIGPNGEQLTSTDPYNTTVFVGGLSPLISEDTLRTFFAPFGDIHYVKVPVGKHCGFVQFVRKADAERAIEKMQGFPIGGSRIRLSWGRSQYKAAQAAAQAAQAAALQVQYSAQASAPSVSNIPNANSPTTQPPQVPSPSSTPSTMQRGPALTSGASREAAAIAAAVASATTSNGQGGPGGLTHEQAIALLANFGYFDQHQQNSTTPTPTTSGSSSSPLSANAGLGGLADSLYAPSGSGVGPSPFSPPTASSAFPTTGQSGFQVQSNLGGGSGAGFSPFSPDPSHGHGHHFGGIGSNMGNGERKASPPYAGFGGSPSPTGHAHHHGHGGATSPTTGSSNPRYAGAGGMFERPSSGSGVIRRPTSGNGFIGRVGASGSIGGSEEVEDVNGTLASLKLDAGA